MKVLSALFLTMVTACCICSAVFAGSLDSTAAPGATNSYTLEDIWNRLNSGTAGSQSTFAEPSSGPTAGTGHTLNEIMSIAPAADSTNGASPADVVSGKKFWGLTGGAWGLQTGTASGGGGGVPETGQTAQYDSNAMQADDGGADPPGDTLPTPRFEVNADTTVTDKLTGLIWGPDANLIATRSNGTDDTDGTANDGRVYWQTALDFIVTLNSENYLGHNDWHLPTLRELQSLINYKYFNPALSNDAGDNKWGTGTSSFTNVQMFSYWSSTTNAFSTIGAWRVDLRDGIVSSGDKALGACYVWAVR